MDIAKIRIGADSQCVSYIIDAMQGVLEPRGPLADEKKALFRIYLYLPRTIFVTPTVMTECAEIRNSDLRTMHESFFAVFFDEVIIEESTSLEPRIEELKKMHRGAKDCQILAESESGNIDVLLTYDSTMISHLRDASKTTKLAKPTEIWRNLAIPRGSRPDKIPHSTNPLSKQEWWIW